MNMDMLGNLTDSLRGTNKRNVNKFGWKKIAGAVLAALLLLIYWPIHSVPSGYAGVITTMGKATSQTGDGIAFTLPWQQLHHFSLRSKSTEIKSAEGSTKDIQPVYVGLVVRYSTIPNKTLYVFEKYSRDGELDAQVAPATAEVFKSVTAKYKAAELIALRQIVSNDVFTELNKKLAVYGAQVDNVDMTAFAFSKTYMAAINEKVTQEELQRAAENKLKTVESEQKQKVAVAEAEASAAKATADGRAYVTLSNAKAEAESIRLRSQALTANKDILELKRIEVEMAKAGRWDGKLPVNMYGSAPIPFMNTATK